MSYLWSVIIVLGIYHTIRIYRAGRVSKEQNPPVEYLTRSSENTDPWRWRKPSENLNIQLRDDSEKSSLVFDTHLNFTDYFVSAAGLLSYIAGVGFALMAVYYYFAGGESAGLRVGGGLTISVFGFIFGSVAHTMRQRVSSLTRTPSKLVLEYTYGAFFKRKVTFTKHDKVKVKVKDQSISDYDSSQAAPFYELLISKSKLISFAPVKFYIYVNQSQVSWVQGGISEWIGSEKKSSGAKAKETEIYTAEGVVKSEESQKRESEERPSVS